MKLIKAIFYYLTLPFVVFIKVLFFPVFFFVWLVKDPKRGKVFKLLLSVVDLIIILPFWALLYFGAYITFDRAFINPIYLVPVSGTGSMYPTFPEGNGLTNEEKMKETVANVEAIGFPNGLYLNGKRYFLHELQRGDIVSFTNEVTKKILNDDGQSGFIKRIVGLPGDTVELRSGLVYLNGVPLKEPYTAQAHATFGGDFLPECTVKKVPDGKYFVMGDNRKLSNDSRTELGFIDYKDIDTVITAKMQETEGLEKNWRDAKNDLSDSSKIKLTTLDFVNLINQQRVNKGISPLKENAKLDSSSKMRAEAILKFNDFSFDGSKSGLGMKKAIEDAGYSNVQWGEIRAQGYYTAQELIDHLTFDQSSMSGFLLNKDFQDVGIVAYEGLLENCPTQLIVIQLGGYIPPNYKSSDIQLWKDSLKNLKDIQPGWQALEKDTRSEFYIKNKTQIISINKLIQLRIDGTASIVKTMEANEWLSKEQEDFIDQSVTLAKEEKKLADYINGK
jgi:signal peptidase I